jgi:hypothetical protein
MVQSATNGKETEEWKQYQAGINYNHKINLYETVNKNERFYAGDQWSGVVSNGLPTPVFNILKRIINYFVSAILSQNTTLHFVPETSGNGTPEEEEQIKKASQLISDYSATLWEKNKMNYKLRQWLLDSAISGDACGYVWWNPNIDTGQMAQGDIDVDAIDNVNVFFGDPNERDVQKQRYIIISARELVANLQDEARANGMSEEDVGKISSDEDSSYQSGDRSKIQLENKSEGMGKTTSLLKLYKKNGTVYAKKLTKFTAIREEWDTRLSLYPVTWMNWDLRKNSYHGQALVTGIIPNQIFINKMFAMSMMSLMHTAFPKVIYNKNMISAWNNQIGSAIGIERMGNESISNVAQYMNAGQMSEQVMRTIDQAINYTKDMLGANDNLLGDINPERASGRSIIAVQQASAVPLENIKQHMYQFLEDMGYIWLDYVTNYYGVRKIDAEILGQRQVVEFDFDQLRAIKFRLKIEVGASSYWSELASIETLDKLLQQESITFKQYLERIPAGLIAQKQSLLEDIKNQDVKQKFIYEQMARFVEQLPPEMQMQIQQLPPEEQEQQIMGMMMQPQPPMPPQMQPQMQQQPGQQVQQPLRGGEMA